MNAKRSQVRHAILAYGLACGSVAAATAVTRHLEPVLGETISPLFFAAVMLSSWYGGLGPALLSTALAGWASAYFFPNNPPGSPLFSWDDAIRLAVFLLVSVLIASLTSLRRRAQEALERSHAELEDRVLQRTAELQAANERLSASEERFRALINGVEDYAIVMLDRDGHVVSWNGGAGRIEGYTPAEIEGQHVSRFFTPEDVAAGEPERQLIIAAAAGRQEDEGYRVRKDGSRFLANVVTTALRTDRGDIRGFAQITRDVTELRNLERRVTDLGESERRRIGRDLHDGLGQHLTGLALLTQNLSQELVDRGVPEHTVAERILAMTNEAIEQVRDVAHGLSPVELGPDGLRAALRNLGMQVCASGGGSIDCRVAYDDQVRVHDAEVALHLYRIAQEAVNNAIRHGKATAIDVRLERRAAGPALVIRDNGIGFAAAAAAAGARAGGLGLRAMSYRARIIGAKLDVRPETPAGTTVCCADWRACTNGYVAPGGKASGNPQRATSVREARDPVRSDAATRAAAVPESAGCDQAAAKEVL